MILEQKELAQIVGGIAINSAIITSIYRAASAVFEIGQAFGSAIRRLTSRSVCQL